MTPYADDQQRAEAEHHARTLVLTRGADELPRPPWLHPGQPPSAADLVRFVTWRDAHGRATAQDVEAALGLLSAARAEADQLETALLFTARGHGMSWSRIARAMGLGSAQAALQRFTRLSDRVRGEAR